MEFKPRKTIPEKGNKYYNRQCNGGYGTSIQGYPVCEGLDVLANCVGYAAGRFNEIGNYGKWQYFNYPPNAEDFWTVNSGLSKGQEPKLGAIMVWEGIGSKAGHVAIVEEIGSNYVISSESGYGCAKPFWTQQRFKGDGNWGAGADYKFLGFIYQPSDSPTPVPTPSRVIKEGDKGEDVKEMQTKLAALGYLRFTEIDGDFGKITKGALCCFQLEKNLDVDALCGPATKKALGMTT